MKKKNPMRIAPKCPKGFKAKKLQGRWACVPTRDSLSDTGPSDPPSGTGSWNGGNSGGGWGGQNAGGGNAGNNSGQKVISSP